MYIKIFTFLTQKEIDEIITEHNKNKGLGVLQNHLANSLTKLIHGEKELENAVIVKS